jgi:hypothetical protein
MLGVVGFESRLLEIGLAVEDRNRDFWSLFVSVVSSGDAEEATPGGILSRSI